MTTLVARRRSPALDAYAATLRSLDSTRGWLRSMHAWVRNATVALERK